MYNLNFVKDRNFKILHIKVFSDGIRKGRDLLEIKALNLGYTRKNSTFEWDEKYLFNYVYIKLKIIPKDCLIDNFGNKFYINKITEKEQLIKAVYSKLIAINKTINYDLVKSVVEQCYKEYKEG